MKKYNFFIFFLFKFLFYKKRYFKLFNLFFFKLNILNNFIKFKNYSLIFFLKFNNYFFFNNFLNSKVKLKLLNFYYFSKNININKNFLRNKYNFYENILDYKLIENEKKLNYFIFFILELIFFKKKNLFFILQQLLVYEFNLFKNDINKKNFFLKNINLINENNKKFFLFLNILKIKKLSLNNFLLKKKLKNQFFKIKKFYKKKHFKKKFLKLNLFLKKKFLILKKTQNINKKKKLNKNKNLKKNKIIRVFKFFSKLIKLNTKNGLKKKSLKLLNDGFRIAKRELKLKLSNKKMLFKIFKNLNPYFVLKKFNLGRRVVLIPFPLLKRKRVAVSARLFLNSLKKRTELSFKRKLIEEIKNFFQKKGKPFSIRARNDRIKLAIANKGNVRFLKFI